MQTLESMRNRIESAKDLHAVVRVMKALSSVSLRQYEKALLSLAEYSRTIEMGLQIVLQNQPETVNGAQAVYGQRCGILIFGSDQGMCGSFNELIANYALDEMSKLTNKPEDRSVLLVGMRVLGRLEDAGYKIESQFPVPSSVGGISSVVDEILLKVEQMRFQEGVEQFLLLHHKPVSASSSRPVKTQLLPVDQNWLKSLTIRKWHSRTLPMMTMEWHRLFSSLIRQQLFVNLYGAIVDSMASENASRLASMQAAEKNITDHIEELSAKFHRERQQLITEELLDVIAGFETLKTTTSKF